MSTPLRRIPLPGEEGIPKPLYAVWELTLRCDQPCQHCGSRAGSARSSELSTEEVREVGRALARLGTQEVTLIGGEAYLRPDLMEIVTFLAGEGMLVTMQTGGRALTPKRADALKAAGLYAIGLSIDGPADVHDVLRGNTGSHAAALRALDASRAAGLPTSVNTQVNRLNHTRLRETAELLRDHHVGAWRAQLTVPMGNAADHPEWILEPWQILDVMDTLAAIQLDAVATPRAWEAGDLKRRFDVQAGNNIGYYGPHETVLRSRVGRDAVYWQGCIAGIYTISIESDGTVKACPSLPTAPYTGGNVRTLAIEEIWAHAEAIRFVRDRTTAELWGYCKTCYYADVCRAGCSFTAHTTLGRRGNNPFCYHRAADLRKKGLRERLVHAEAAGGVPYDFGRFEIALEPWPSADPSAEGVEGSA
jgi:radical SAM protein with 4Fe4S-binding SPASM domain